jgi:hypothetical protein
MTDSHLLRSLLAIVVLLTFPTFALGAAPAPAAAAEEAAAAPASLLGDWEGILDAGTARLRVVFHVSEDSDGGLSATLDSPDQGATGIPVSLVELDGHSVQFRLDNLQARFEGTLANDGGSLAGDWHQSGQQFPLALERATDDG